MIIFDCDNCIADDEWRIRTIDWDADDPMERYETYHQLSRYDECKNKHLMERGRKIAIFTAMPEKYRSLREDWFHRNSVRFDVLYMRSNLDFRPSTQIKRDMLELLLRRTQLTAKSIVAAYDDRADIVTMYKQNGVNGINLAIHNNCAFTKPGNRP